MAGLTEVLLLLLLPLLVLLWLPLHFAEATHSLSFKNWVVVRSCFGYWASQRLPSPRNSKTVDRLVPARVVMSIKRVRVRNL
jgi:hypothetical protein